MNHNARYARPAADADNRLGFEIDRVPHITPQERRDAALTVAEAALRQDWALDALGDVLDALGLGGGQA